MVNFLEIGPYKDSLLDCNETGDENRAEIRKNQIICKPIVMRALSEAIISLRSPNDEGGRLSWKDCLSRIEIVNWSYDNDDWNGILLQGGKIIAGTPAMKLASRFIAYLLGGELDDFELKDLKNKYRSVTGGKPDGSGGFTGGNELPDRVVN
ncbi:DNA sulfur modification protein DndB [bacterium]|nr:DNA sulfur modification protein DndB [bacterium]